jgi:hypothetical protein
MQRTLQGDSTFRPDGKSDPSPHGYKRSGEVRAKQKMARDFKQQK